MPNEYYKMPESCQIGVMGQILEQHLGKKSDGLFVEIGANDGETYGCTAGLADMGWTGFYVEPVPYLAEMCVRRHKKNNVRVDQCAIGDHNGFIVIHVSSTQNGAYSTSKLEDVEKHSACFTGEIVRANLFTMDYYMCQLELRDYLEQPDLSYVRIDLMVVDTEGTELEVIKGFTYLKDIHPTVLVIEHNTDPVTLSGLEQYVYPEYELVYVDAVNFVFVWNPDGLPRKSLVAIIEEMKREIDRINSEVTINGKCNNNTESKVGVS